MGRDTRSTAGRAARRGAALSLLAGFIAWNVVFDRMVADAGRDYVARQHLHEQQRGPAVTIEGVMAPARKAAARTATLAGLSVTGTGAAVTAFLSVRRRARPAVSQLPQGPAGKAAPR